MVRLITQYTILVSCPGDVEEELEVINQVIDSFNKSIGEANNVNLAVKHWTTHVYPESGGKPQELINKQMVLGCDAAIAVFWTRFGTPTDDYGSGTEEEIELLLKEDKQVFLYFSNKPLPPRDMNSEQYMRVQEFQSKYRDKGIYSEYNDIEQFKQNFTNHLNSYFLKRISENDSLSTYSKAPSLSIKGIYKGEIIDKPKFIQPTLRESQFIKQRESEIKEVFTSVKDIDIPIKEEKIIKRSEDDTKEMEVSDALKDFRKVISGFNSNIRPVENINEDQEVQFVEADKEVVCTYATTNDIIFDKTLFFNIGNLTETKKIFGGGQFGSSPSYQLNGSKEEKEKYRLIKDLILKINHISQWKNYFKEVDSKYLIRLAVSNNGTTFDEDVDIKLFIERNKLVKKKDIPFPGIEILKPATELLEKFYKIDQSHSIEEYVGSQTLKRNYIPNMPMPGRGYQESIEDLKETFKENIDDIFVYDYYQDERFDIIIFNISYIKQYTNIGFPSLLLFHSNVKEIKYEINSKHSPEIFQGTLEITGNDSK